jgi:hypothetical protein
MPGYRKPDAILVDRAYPPGSPQDDSRHRERNRLLGPIFGVPRVMSALCGQNASQSIVFPSQVNFDHARYFPQAHPLMGQEKYEWFVTSEGQDGTLAPAMPVTPGEQPAVDQVFFGYAVADPYAEDTAVQVAVQQDMQRRIDEYRASPAGQARMAELLADRGEVPVDTPVQGITITPASAAMVHSVNEQKARKK